MLALSIRQPYAEQILRGEKKIEYRSRPTRRIGERFYIYAARKWAAVPGHDVAVGLSQDEGETALTPGPSPGGRAEQAVLPTGVIVGSAVISDCTRHNGTWEWRLRDVKRYTRLRRPKRQPQPVWFRPF